MTNPIVKISAQGEEFLRKGQMWMYINNLPSDISDYENGCEVDVESMNGEYLGNGLLSKDSHITVRLFSKKHEPVEAAFFAKKIQQAWDFRKTVEPKSLDNCRIILGEAAQETGVILKQVSVTQQNEEHPILWTMEESSLLCSLFSGFCEEL